MEKYVASVHLVGMGRTERPQHPIKEVLELVGDERGEVEAIYPLVGAIENLLVICSFPNLQAATRAWYAIDAQFGWQTRLNQCLTTQEFEETFSRINGKVAAGR